MCLKVCNKNFTVLNYCQNSQFLHSFARRVFGMGCIPTKSIPTKSVPPEPTEPTEPTKPTKPMKPTKQHHRHGSRSQSRSKIVNTTVNTVKVSHRRSITWTTIVVSGSKVGLPVAEDRVVDSLDVPPETKSKTSGHKQSPSFQQMDPKLEQYKRAQAKEKSQQWQRRTTRGSRPQSFREMNRAQTQSSIN